VGWLAAGLGFACSTAETPLFSDGACVAGGCASTSAASSTSSSGVACTVDTTCAVSWATDIFTPILDGPAGCTAMTCHGGGAGGITLTTGEPTGAYMVLTGYTLLPAPGPAKPYIVPCSPSASGFPCNMLLGAGGGTNSYGTCGTNMPLVLGGEMALTEAQVSTIADWITCGAPDN
jgi:hypothetical protein